VADDFCRDSGNDRVGGNVSIDHAVGADHHTLTDMTPWHDDGTGADQNIVSNGYSLVKRPLIDDANAFVAKISAASKNGHAWSDTNVISNNYILRSRGDVIKAADG
jgi:hypothetical protein